LTPPATSSTDPLFGPLGLGFMDAAEIAAIREGRFKIMIGAI
jgi:hypothetical protein